MKRVILKKLKKMEKEVKEEISCYGCLHDIANQLGHMDEGGCLYEE